MPLEFLPEVPESLPMPRPERSQRYLAAYAVAFLAAVAYLLVVWKGK